MAVFAAAAVLVMLWRAARSGGAGPWLAMAVVVAFVAGPASRVPVALGAPAMLATALAWLAVAASARRDLSRASHAPHEATAGTATLLVAVAAASLLWPPIVVVVPLLAGRAPMPGGGPPASLWQLRRWSASPPAGSDGRALLASRSAMLQASLRSPP